MIKCIELIKSENTHIVKNLGIYIYKAFQIRMKIYIFVDPPSPMLLHILSRR